jgi:hypothetical protein
MILLKIKTPGHLISIPGLPTFRTPAEVDVSKIDIRVVHMYLVTAGIDEYEIVAETKKGGKEVYKREDFDEVKSLTKRKPKDDKNLDSRLDNLEMMLSKLLAKDRGDKTVDSEQITNKLTKLEKLVSNFSTPKQEIKQFVPNSKKEPVIEELDSFIPDIDISDMTIKSKVKTLKQDGSVINDAADILSNLVKKKGKDND